MHTFLQVDDGPFLSLVVPLIALSSAPLSPGFFSFQCGTKRAQSKATIGLVVVALISLFVDTAGRKKERKKKMSTRYAHTRLHPYRLGDVVNVVAGSRVKTSRSLSFSLGEAAPYRIHNTRFRMKKRTCPFPNFLAVRTSSKNREPLCWRVLRMEASFMAPE